MKMIVDPQVERLRFLLTNTTLPDYAEFAEEGRTPEETEATIVTVVQLVIDAVASDVLTPKPSEHNRFPALLADELNLLYIRTMAPVGGAAVMELFASEEGSPFKAQYMAALTAFNTECTKVISGWADEELPKGPGRKAEKGRRRMLLNNHLWMIDPRAVLRIWVASDVMPYMLKSVLVTLNAMVVKVAPALCEVR